MQTRSKKRSLSDSHSLPSLHDGTGHGRKRKISEKIEEMNMKIKIPEFMFDENVPGNEDFWILKKRLPSDEEKLAGFKSLVSSDYLVSYDKKQSKPARVPVSFLDGKYVLFFRFCLKREIEQHWRPIHALSSQLESSGKADQVVFVIILGRVSVTSSFTSSDFDDFFSSLPFTSLTIPFSDTQSRRHLLYTYRPFYCLLTLDPSSAVLPFDSFQLSRFGSQSFPFTLDHFQKVFHDDHILETFLSPRNPLVLKDYAPTPGVLPYEFDPSKVSLTLEGLLECKTLRQIKDGRRFIATSDLDLGVKPVALYLYSTGNYIRRFKEVYEQCVDQGYPLEVVLVPLPYEDGQIRDDPAPFCNSMKKIALADSTASSAWWLFPFSDKICRRLWRFASHLSTGASELDALVILPRPGGIGDACAINLLDGFGISAYPFTRHAFVEAKLKHYRSVSLEALLGVDFIHKWGLQNKNLLLYFDHPTPAEAIHYKLVNEEYPKIKSKYEDAEIVFIPLEDVASPAQKDWLSKMKWPVLTEDKRAFVIKHLFNHELYKRSPYAANLVAFGKDGKLLSRYNALSRLPLSNASHVLPLFDDSLRHDILADVEGATSIR